MDRKFLLLLGGILLLLLFLAACGPAATPTTAPQPTNTEAAPPPQETPTAEEEEEEAQPPSRGCLACHVLVDPETGRYTLAWEAAERAQARGLSHPTSAPDGTSIAVTEVVGVEVCLQCHGQGAGEREGLGTFTTHSLMDIIHPAHMFSSIFREEFAGNCFSCHNVNSSGEFQVLGEAVEVNEKGVPEVVPIPGIVQEEE